jgi:dGTPase
LPDFYKDRLEFEDIDVVLCDYISGMSDMYAVKTFSEIFIPKNWKL